MLKEPKFFDSEYVYADDEWWHIKDEAPESMKKEFNDFFNMLSKKPNENGLVTQY